MAFLLLHNYTDFILKDKEIEQLKLHHELELKSKEADIVNPIMGEFMKEIFKDPSKVNQLMELQNTIEVINSKGGVNMNSKDIYSLWMEAWNKDINAVNEIADDNCTVHQSRIDEQYSESLKGPNALKDIINSSKYYFKEYEMSLIVGPIVDKNYISARWNFTGVYDGNMEGAKAKAGTKVSFDGTDIFYIENEKIKDYWVSSDGISFMKQLEAF